MIPPSEMIDSSPTAPAAVSGRDCGPRPHGREAVLRLSGSLDESASRLESTSTVLDQMAGLSSAEEFFTLLGVPFEQPVVHVKRLHILKSFNQRLATLDAKGLDDQIVRQTCAAMLTEAYAEVQASSPQETRLFKVFRQDALTGSPGRAFVPLDSITR